MGNNKSYSEKLLRPEWQKKRLLILERDHWTCQSCYSTEKTLHVHHKRYISGREPWDYPDSILITLCADCHTTETELMEDVIHDLIAVIKEKFLADDIHKIIEGLINYNHPCEMTELSAATIKYILSNPDIIRKSYMDYIISEKPAND